MAGPLWLMGEATADLHAAVAPLAHVTMIDAVTSLRRAGHLARLAVQAIAAGQVDSLAALQPLYLRNP